MSRAVDYEEAVEEGLQFGADLESPWIGGAPYWTRSDIHRLYISIPSRDAAAAFLKEFGWTDEEIAAIEDEGDDE